MRIEPSTFVRISVASGSTGKVFSTSSSRMRSPTLGPHPAKAMAIAVRIKERARMLESSRGAALLIAQSDQRIDIHRAKRGNCCFLQDRQLHYPAVAQLNDAISISGVFLRVRHLNDRHA